MNEPALSYLYDQPIRSAPIWAQSVSAPVVSISSADELQSFVEPWNDLATHASEPNVFYESWMLLPALRTYSNGKVEVLLVWSLGNDGAPLLIGLLPVQRRRLYRGMPFPHLSTWEYVHCYLGSPLVRHGYEEVFFEKLLRHMERHELGMFLELRTARVDGPLAVALQNVSDKIGSEISFTSRHERALLCSHLSADVYIEQALTKKRRKEFSRLSRRLSELGEVKTNFTSAGDDIDRWIENFLKLELSGWKGRAGTALAVKLKDSAFFTTVVREAFKRKQLAMMEITLNGEPLAQQCNFTSGLGSFSFKITYDERYAKFSPGIQLELDNLSYVLSDPTVRWMDSCAEPGHSMINRLWNQRRSIANVIISGRGVLSRNTVSILGSVHALYMKFGRDSHEELDN